MHTKIFKTKSLTTRMKKEEQNVVIVAIDNYSWKVLMDKGFYAFPIRTRKVGEYFAFYQKEPISAVTHYGKVIKAEEGGKTDVGIGYWLNCFPDAEPPFQIVRFDRIIKLKSPIKKDSIGRGGVHIQGRVYTSFKKLMKAKKISQLL